MHVNVVKCLLSCDPFVRIELQQFVQQVECMNVRAGKYVSQIGTVPLCEITSEACHWDMCTCTVLMLAPKSIERKEI